MDLTGATVTAQQNATLIMMYLHTVRMVFAQLLKDRRQGVLSLDFMTKMAATTSDESMENFVKKVGNYRNQFGNVSDQKVSQVSLKIIFG